MARKVAEAKHAEIERKMAEKAEADRKREISGSRGTSGQKKKRL